MRGVEKQAALYMWYEISAETMDEYRGKVRVVHDEESDKTECINRLGWLGTKKALVKFGLKSFLEKDAISQDEFIWMTHKLIHEFGHVNQRMNLFDKQDEDSIQMAKQQIICLAFPKYKHSSYHSQLVEIDAERYSWQKTVELLSTKYSDVFTEDDVKQSLVNGLYKYQGVWYTDKNFSTWEDGLKNLNDAFEQAKYKTWDVHNGWLSEQDDNSFAEQFEAKHRIFEKYLHTFGSERNDLLFRYCVTNNMVDTKKFSCLKKEVKAIKRELRRLPDISDMPCDMEDSRDKDSPDL